VILIRTLVFQALENAKENGYDFVRWPPENIAIDILMYDAPLHQSGATPDQLVPFIIEWQKGSEENKC